MNRYAIIVFWSEDDRAWVADIPDLKSCAAFGSTPEEAFAEGSFPVGLVPEAEYTAVCLRLEPGDTMVLFSDGVTEAMDPVTSSWTGWPLPML